MDDQLGDYPSKTVDTDLEPRLLDEKLESNQTIRKSSRPRKQSKRVLDSADSDDIDLVSVPVKKKHRRDVKLKTGQKKSDILPNGRPFKCNLCGSTYINNSPAKAKVKKELQPIIKEKFGQLLQLCVKCAIALNHTESKGPTPEQRAEFEEEGKLFAQRLVKYLNDSAASRLYCSFYQTTKCGCIQSYITGTPVNRKKKPSLAGSECGTSDTGEVKQEDDEKEQAQKARYLLSLLKESMAKKQTPATKKSIEKSHQVSDDGSSAMKESEKFILANRVKLKELGICERGCQKVLCYSNNFLHKKSVGSQPRLQRTKGRAALGRLTSLQDLQKMRCCDKNCVKMVERDQEQVEHWRERAKQGQKEMWRVLEEMLTFTDTGSTNCYKFISMVTGCCLTTVQKVYADVLLSRGTAGGASKREHGMRFHWKRQKELGKSHRGQTVATPLDNSQQANLDIHSQPLAAANTSLEPSSYGSHAGFSESTSSIMKENLHHLQPQCSHEAVSENTPQVEENKNEEVIKEKFLQVFGNIEDPKVFASLQQMLCVQLATLQKDIKVKQEKEHMQQETTTISIQTSDDASASMASSSSSVYASSSVSLVSTILQTPSCSSNNFNRNLSKAREGMQASSISTSRIGKPYAQQFPAEQITTVKQSTKISNEERRVPSTTFTSTGQNLMKSAANSAKEPIPSVDLYSVKTERSIAQILNHPNVLSNLAAQPNFDTIEAKSSIVSSQSSAVGSTATFSIGETSSLAVPITAGTSLDQIPQQVSFFQIVPHPDSANSQVPSQIISVCPPQHLPLQQLPLPPSSNTQHIQFQLVSPLVMGQTELMFPLNQSEPISFILPKQPPTPLQNPDNSSNFNPSGLPKDSVIIQTSALQQSLQNISVLSNTSARLNESSLRQQLSDFQPQTGSSFSSNTTNSQQTKEIKSLPSVKSEVHKTQESFHNQGQKTNSDQNLVTTTSPSDPPSSSESGKPQLSGSNSQSVAVFNYFQNSGQDGEAVYQLNSFDQYFPSSFLSQTQTQGTILVGTPSSSSSGSFVFDALADSPVKDPFSLSSPLLVKDSFSLSSPLQCDMLTLSTAPSATCSSSPLDLFLQTSSSSLSLLSCGPPTQGLSSQNSISGKQLLLTSVPKTSPMTSAYCQSLKFSTHTTPSVMSNQPIVTSSRLEQTSPATSSSIGHNPSFSHSQISINRLNRQREPPQVGIVHPHISGVKTTSSGHHVHSQLSNSSVLVSNHSTHNSLVSNSSVAHVNSFEPLPSSSSSFITLDNANYQVATLAQELTANLSQSPQHHHHLLLSLLLSSQQAGGQQQPSLTSSSQQGNGQLTLASYPGNPGSFLAKASSCSEHLYQGEVFDTGFQNTASTSSCNTSTPGSQSVTNASGSLTPHQSPVSTGNQIPVSTVNQTNLSLLTHSGIPGGSSSHTEANNPQLYQTVMNSNTGQMKLIPLVLSEGTSSVSGLFQQDCGQLLLNMSPYTGFGNFSNLSPQSLNRDTNITLNTPESSSQNMSEQQPLAESSSNVQTSSFLSLQSPSIQNIQFTESSPQPKDHLKTLQVNVTPFRNQLGQGQLLFSQSKSQRGSNLPLNMIHKESQNGNKLERNLITPLSNSFAPVVGKLNSPPGQSLTHNFLPSTSTSDILKDDKMLGKDTYFQPIYQNVQVSESPPKICMGSEAVYRAGTTISGVTTSHQGRQTKSFDLTTCNDQESQNKISDCDGQTERKLHDSIFSHAINNENLIHQLSASTTQPQQLPLQVVTMLQTQDQACNDEAFPSSRTKNQVLSQPCFNNTGLGQTFLNIAGTNQIFLPVQSIPFNENVGLNQTVSNIPQATPQISELPKVLLQSSSSASPGDSTSQMSLISVTKQMNTSVQPTPTSSGSQPSSTSKHRPIRPKLQPVPAVPQKISLMLVPDRPGYPAYQLAQVDQAVLPLQQTSEQFMQKERAQQPHNTFLFPGNSQQPQSAMLTPGNSQQPSYTMFVPENSQEPQNAFIVPGNSYSIQGNSSEVPRNSQQHSNNILVPINSQFVPRNSQESHNVVLVPGNSQQLMNAFLVPGNTQQSPNSLMAQGNSQQLLNAIIVPGSSQQLLNAVLVPENVQNSPLVTEQFQNKVINKPTPNAAIINQLRTKKTNQQSHDPGQNLLISHTDQGANIADGNPVNEILPMSLQQRQPLFQALPKASKESQAVTHQASEIIPQKDATNQTSSYQMDSVTFTSPEATLGSFGTFEDSSTQNGSIQPILSQNKEFQVGVFQNGSVFVSSLPDGTFPTDLLQAKPLEVSNLQSNGSLLPSSSSSEASESDAVNNGKSQFSSVVSKGAAVRQPVQSDIQRLNPQVAAQLSSDVLMFTPQKHLSENPPLNIQPQLTMALSSQNIQPIQSEFRENKLQSVRSHTTILDLTPRSQVEPSHNILMQPKLAIKEITMQTLENKVLAKIEGDATQPSCFGINSSSPLVHADKVSVLSGSEAPLSLPSDCPSLPPQVFVSTKLMQSPALFVGTRTSSVKEEVKPTAEPTQYLECKEVIDLTEDNTPPVSPPRGSQNKESMFGVVPTQSNQSLPSLKYNELQRQISDNHTIAQSHLLFQNIILNNQLEDSQHPKNRTDLKPCRTEMCHAQSEITPAILSDGSEVTDTNDQNLNLVMIENIGNIPANIRQELIASLEAHAAGNPDVHLVTRTFTPNEEMPYQGLLSSKGSSQQAEDQLNAITKAISRNKCPSAVVTISTNQRFQQSLARAKTQGTLPVLGMSLVADDQVNKWNLAHDDGGASQTVQRSVTSQNNHPKLSSSSLSSFGNTNNIKQNVDMSSSAKVLSRSSSTASSSSDVPGLMQGYSLSTASGATASSLPAATSSPSLVPTTPLSASSNIKATAGRSVVHPLVSSAVAFMRTTSTPTDAVGPPNITIMSPAHTSSAPLLRFRHDTNNISTTTPTTMIQSSPSVCLNPVTMTTPAQTSSGLLKFTTSTTSTPVPGKTEGSQDQLILLLCPNLKEKSTALLGRRLSLENISQTSSPKDVPVFEASSPSLGSRSVGNLIKSFESPAHSKPKTRKKTTTIMDLLRNKEKLQASVSAASSINVPISSTPGPVTLMISGAAGTPNLLVRDSGAGQSRVDPNSLNITVKNLQLLGKLTSNTDKNIPSNQISSVSQHSGFTILQPNILPASVFTCNTATASAPVTSLPVLELIPTTGSLSSLSTSHTPNAAIISKSAIGPHSISLSAQKYTNNNQFLGNLAESHQNESKEPIAISSQMLANPISADQIKNTSVSNAKLFSLNETYSQIPVTFGQESTSKHKQAHVVNTTENSVQLQMIGQPPVVSVPFHSKVSDLPAQKSQAPMAEMFVGEKLKFKTTSTRNKNIEFKPQEGISQNLQLENLQKNQLAQSTGTIKKLLLLNKPPSVDVQSSSFTKPTVQVTSHERQASSEQKQLSLKSPQLLQLMKSNQPTFTHGSPEQIQQSPISHSPGYEKPTQLKLPNKPASLSVNVDSYVHMSRPASGAQEMTNYQSSENTQHRLSMAKTILLDTVDQGSLSETSSNSKRSLLPSQNPLLANILFTSNTSSTSSSNSASYSSNKTSLHLESPVKNSSDWRNRYEKMPQQLGVLSQDYPAPSEHLLEEFLLGNSGERCLNLSNEREHKSNVETGIVLKAPPAYNQPPRYEVATKDMTRVNKVIKDIYKFTGDEPSVYWGSKSQNSSPKGKIVPSHGKFSNSSYEINKSNQSFHQPENTLNPTGTFPETAQFNENALYVAAEFSQAWRSSKKLKSKKKNNDKSNSKFNSKKVQFSDVVTSKADSECGQFISGSSDVDVIPSEMTDKHPQDQLLGRDKHPQDQLLGRDCPESRSQNSWETNQFHSGRQQKPAEGNHEDQAGHDRYSHMVETETQDSKQRVNHLAQTEPCFKRSETHPVNKDKFSKTFAVNYTQRENDSLFGTGYGFHNERESNKFHQNFSKVNQKSLPTTLTEYEHGLKERAEKIPSPQQEYRHMEENLYVYPSGFIQESIDNSTDFVCGRTEASLNSVQDTRPTEPTMEPFREVCKGINVPAHGKSENSIRDTGKRRQLMSSESFLFSTSPDHVSQIAEKKHYMTEKKELIPPSPDSSISGSVDRDSDFDQQSSFNILSTQGYSKLSKQRLSRAQSGPSCLEGSTHTIIKSTQFSPQGFIPRETSFCSDQYEDTRDFPYNNKLDTALAGNISNGDYDRQPSESPLIRQKMLESNFELAQQMKKGHVHILKDSSSEGLNERQLESPYKYLYSDRRPEALSTTGLVLRDAESQLGKELDFRALSGPSSRLTSPTFTNSLEGRSNVLSSIESFYYLRKEIKTLTGENQYLKQEVAKAEKEKEQQRQRQLSSSDKQRNSVAEPDKIYYTSQSGASCQSYAADNESVMPPRKRHPSSTVGMYNNLLNNLPNSGSELPRQEEGFQKKGPNLPVAFSGVQPGLETEMSLESSSRNKVAGFLYSRNLLTHQDDYSPPESYGRDPFVSSISHRRPASQLDFGVPQYESVRHRYPSSEMRPMSSRGFSDGDGFVPLQEHTRHRNLSSSLGLRALSDIDPPPYDVTQRQRNPSASSVKSSYQDPDLPGFDLGTRSRNPSSSSWLRYWESLSDNGLAVVRSRNPSGSSNRRSRPGSSSSDRELPVNMDELPLFSDIARTRSRNSSGESIEPTVEFLDPQQFSQYAYPAMEVHIKRTKH